MVHVRLARRIVTALDVAVVGGDVQGSPTALVGEVGIRTVVEKVHTEPIEAVLSGVQQRGPTVLAGLVHIGPALQQDFDRLQVPLPRRENQRRQASKLLRPAARHRHAEGEFRKRRLGPVPLLRERPVRLRERFRLIFGARHAGIRRVLPDYRPALAAALDEFLNPVSTGIGEIRHASGLHRPGLRIDVRTLGDEQAYGVCVRVRGSPHQCGRAAQALAGLDLGPMGEQLLEHRHGAGPRRHHQGCFTVAERLVGIGAGAEKELDHFGGARLAGERQGGHSCVGHGGSLCASGEQLSGGGCIGTVSSPVQCRRTVGLRRVHVGGLREQRA